MSSLFITLFLLIKVDTIVKRILSLLFLIPFHLLFTQNSHFDSLRTALIGSEGRTRMQVLFALSNQLEGLLPKEAHQYGVEGLALAYQLGDSLTAATFLSSLAYSSSELGNFAEALSYGYRSLTLSKAVGDPKKIASANSTLGITYVYLGRYSKALEHHLDALRIREELGMKIPTANTLNNIGVAYHNIGQYDQAIEYYKKGLEMYGPSIGKLIRARYLTNIGFSEFKRGNIDSAMIFYREAERLAGDTPYGVIQSYLYYNLGTLHAEQGNYSQALIDLNRSLESYTVLDQKYGKVQLYNALAGVYVKMRRYPAALRYLDSAVAVAHQISVPEQLKTSYETYYRIYQLTGPLEREYYYFRQYSNAKDSLLNSNESKQIAEVQFAHEMEQQQRTIELLTKEKTIAELSAAQDAFLSNVLYGGIALSILAVGFLYGVVLRIRKKNRLIAEANAELKKVNDDLQMKIGEVNLLTGFLPICANCKKIRDDNGQWEQMEQYISKRSEATFSHGICPDCMKALYGKVLTRYRTE